MKVWLSLLTVVVVLLTAGLIVGLASLNADLARLDSQLAEWKSAGASDALAVPDDPQARAVTPLEARILGTSATSSTFALTVTVRFAGPADLLAGPPVLRGGGKTWPVTPESLAQARFAFLDLVSKGAATATLVFQGVPDAKESLTLVFNPHRRPTDIVAPGREVRVR